MFLCNIKYYKILQYMPKKAYLYLFIYGIMFAYNNLRLFLLNTTTVQVVKIFAIRKVIL